MGGLVRLVPRSKHLLREAPAMSDPSVNRPQALPPEGDEMLGHHARKQRLPGELTFALLMLLLGLTALWLSYQISGFASWSSAGSVPLGTSLVLTVSALMFVRGTLKKQPAPSRPGEPLWHQFYEKVFPARHLIFTAVIVGYMLSLERIGFLAASFLYLTLSSVALGERRWLRMIVINVVILALVYLVFQTAFSVVLPEGPIERIFK
jgi:putative tricarboxylic transport membrane protein